MSKTRVGAKVCCIFSVTKYSGNDIKSQKFSQIVENKGVAKVTDIRIAKSSAKIVIWMDLELVFVFVLTWTKDITSPGLLPARLYCN